MMLHVIICGKNKGHILRLDNRVFDVYAIVYIGFQNER